MVRANLIERGGRVYCGGDFGPTASSLGTSQARNLTNPHEACYTPGASQPRPQSLGPSRGWAQVTHMATKLELQAQLEALTQELNALRQVKAKPGVKRGKGPTKLQKLNRKQGRATNMRYACNACDAHYYHEAKAKAHVCKAGGKATKIKA